MAAEFVERMGARMRERRENLGLSMAEVARRMPGKVSENQVYRWEVGKHQPKPDTLEALASVLECDVAYFLAAPPDDAKRGTPDLAGSLNGDRSAVMQTLARIEAAQADLLQRVDEEISPTLRKVATEIEEDRAGLLERVLEVAKQLDDMQKTMDRIQARLQR